MVKQVLLTTTALFFFGAFTTSSGQASKPQTAEVRTANYKFLDDISVDLASDASSTTRPVAVPAVKKDLLAVAKKTETSIEDAGELQFKYSLLLDVEVELVKNTPLFRVIDEWYGTRYRYGGTTKQGIDCSALMQIFFTSLYGVALPRTARQQYEFSEQISRTELKEGDLLFFNTTGGVSHVGMYLQNNKFVHASSTSGVTISDMFDPYYVNRLVGVGRVLDETTPSVVRSVPQP